MRAVQTAGKGPSLVVLSGEMVDVPGSDQARIRSSPERKHETADHDGGDAAIRCAKCGV